MSSKKEQILNALQLVGSNGITNVELSRIALRYGGYLGNLYEEGYKISKENLGNNVYKYILVSEPKEVVKRPKAIDALYSEIEKLGINKEDLIIALDNSGVLVRYKGNTYNNL